MANKQRYLNQLLLDRDPKFRCDNLFHWSTLFVLTRLSLWKFDPTSKHMLCYATTDQICAGFIYGRIFLKFEIRNPKTFAFFRHYRNFSFEIGLNHGTRSKYSTLNPRLLPSVLASLFVGLAWGLAYVIWEPSSHLDITNLCFIFQFSQWTGSALPNN